MMTPELWQRLKPLYAAALDLPSSARVRFVTEACGEDAELKQELETLLEAHEQKTSTRDGPLVDLLDFTPGPALFLGVSVLNRYKIVRRLGSGGMGEVYEVEDRFLQGVHVAMKTILPHKSDDPDLQKRFEREVLLAREVTHPNLCPMYDIAHCDDPPPGFLFLTMKLLPGTTLSERLKHGAPILPEDRLAILTKIALGLAAIHQANIVHRDIKPGNIMLHGTGAELRLWITDFGLARAYQTETTVVEKSMLAGTRGYMAPELFLGQMPSQASDLFAFGVLLHEVFVNEKPAASPDGTSYAVSPQLASPGVPAFCVTLITECLSQNPKRRCLAFEEALKEVEPSSARRSQPVEVKKFWTRRRFAGAAVAGLCVASGGAWWRWDDLEYLFEPLPDHRSVALMAWPNDHLSAVVSTVLDSIGQRLARAEAYVKDLLIVTFRDLPDGATSPSVPAESVSALGANLVLAASLASDNATHTLTLQVLDAASQRVLRKARVSLPLAELSYMSEKASRTAARLLGLPDKDIAMKDTEELKQVSPEVYSIFSEAEQLANQPNGTGLEAALPKYQQALDLDSHFALCYASLAMAYVKQFQDGDPAKLRLAGDNATLATHYNGGSAKGWLSRAIVSVYSGKMDEAKGYFEKSLQADPGNPETLVYKAEALRETRQWPGAEQVYRDISRERPNYWLAHNELGWILFQQAKYQQAAEEFDAAAAAAPKVALPLANLGLMYLALGKHDEAITASEHSLQRSPNKDAYLTLGDIAFTENNYQKALYNYQQAAVLRPNSHLIYRNIGDCYAVLGDPALVKKNYAKATELLATDLVRSPHDGSDWAILAFYHAKIGDAANAQIDMKNAEARGATDVESQFMICQALALLGKKEEALKLLLSCMDRGLSPVEAGLALDLKEIEKDPRYIFSHLQAPGSEALYLNVRTSSSLMTFNAAQPERTFFYVSHPWIQLHLPRAWHPDRRRFDRAAAPSQHHPSHRNALPGVNISPEVGDTIEWAAYGQTTPPTITFSPFTGSPCRNQNPGSSCVYNEKGNGIYIYSCSGSTTCDPGMGPGSGTKGGNGGIFNPIALLLQGVVFDIDRALGLIAVDQAPIASPSTAGPVAALPASPASALPPALHAADGSNPDGQVGCINGATSINNPSISKTVGQSISWVGGSSFAITMDQSICQGDMSTPSPFQSCKLMKPAPPTAYTITNASCITQPVLNTPTITALAATPAIH